MFNVGYSQRKILQGVERLSGTFRSHLSRSNNPSIVCCEEIPQLLEGYSTFVSYTRSSDIVRVW